MSAADTRVMPLAEDEHAAGSVPALIAALIVEGVAPTQVERAVARARLSGSDEDGALIRAFAAEQAQRLASGAR